MKSLYEDEQKYRNDSQVREQSQRTWDRMQDRNWADEDAAREDDEKADERRQAIAEAPFEFMAAAKCDGSGILEEHYFAADQTLSIPCPGCPACELQPEALAPLPNDPEPNWMIEPELVEFGARRKGVRREISPAAAEGREVA